MQAGTIQENNQVAAWYVNLDAGEDSLSGAHVLSDDERDRASRFHAPLHRRRFIACRAALRRILGEEAGMSAGAIRFQYGRWGKPRLDGNTEDVRFNVAHADGRAIIAVCRHFDVGADLEPLRTVRDRDRVAQLVFSDAELHQLAQSDDKDRLFLSGWTRKEAYIKALGTGFSEPVRRFSVSLADTAALLTPSACGGTVAEWTLVGLEHQTHLIALAARAPDITVQLRIRNG